MDTHETNGRSIPLWAALIIPFSILMIITAGFVLYFSMSVGIESIQTVSARFRDELHYRVQNHIESFLERPWVIVSRYADLIGRGLIDTEKQRELEQIFLLEILHEEGISSLYFGNTFGGLADAGREGHGGAYYYIETDDFSSGILRKYGVTDEGSVIGAQMLQVDNFDTRTRPWYTTALESSGPIFGKPYTLSTGQDMAISVSCPVYTDDGQIAGVVSADIFLSHINAFLSSLEIGVNGLCYIVDDEGYLISVGIDGFSSLYTDSMGNIQRTPASNAKEPRIQDTTLLMDSLGNGNDGTPWTGDTSGTVDGIINRIMVSSINFGNTLSWRIVTVVPKSEFIGPVYDNLRYSVLLVFGATLILITSGIFITRLITAPIHTLGISAERLSRGEWHRISARHWIEEVRDFHSAFDTLSVRMETMVESRNREIEDRKKAEDMITSQHRQLELVIEGGELGTWDWDIPSGRVDFNHRWTEMLGYRLDEIEPDVTTWQRLLHPDDADEVQKVLQAHLEGRSEDYSTEHRLRHKNGMWIWVLDKGKVIERKSDGTPQRACGTHLDITRSKLYEQRIRTLLDEKEILLKEVHHRIKNFMSTIRGLISLQTSQITSETARRHLKDAEQRIQGMMILYDNLYRESGDGEVGIRDYLSSLLDTILATYSTDVTIDREHIDDAVVSMSVAFPLGIIINELISNSMKYAFSGRTDNKISVTAEIRESNMIITVGDNGRGFDTDHVERGFGLELIDLLAGQLGGKFSIVSNKGKNPGTTAIIEFELHNTKSE